MNITPSLFGAFLKCPTKCWLRAAKEPPSGNTYAEWVRTQSEAYRVAETDRLLTQTPPADSALSPPAENLKSVKWRLAVDVVVEAFDRTGSSRRQEAPSSPPQSIASQGTSNGEPTLNLQTIQSAHRIPNSAVEMSLVTSAATPQAGASPTALIAETRLHAVERVLSEGRGKAAQFIPIHFIVFNKLGKDDKLLLAFDAFVLAGALGRDIAAGKIIHGDDHATLKVKTSALAGEVRKRLERIAGLLSSTTPPDLALNRHCAECEFQARCRQKAVETNDLSLLGGMSANERQELRSKGIFTVTQLSYTFRPRRRPKQMRDKRERYHHSLKALAIRDKKIHIVGNPELKIEGTPVYLDVEGLPDRDFYYLIGLRIGNGESAIQHSLWADTVADEGKIWREFLGIIETVEKPVLIHYGGYERTFFQFMAKRHGGPSEGSHAADAIGSDVNLLAVIFAQIYFPTYSNGLKEIAGSLEFRWSDACVSGKQAIIWRADWQKCQAASLKAKIVQYNTEDCEALALATQTISRMRNQQAEPGHIEGRPPVVVQVDDLKRPWANKWRVFSSPVCELEVVNKAAHWDYQRERIYARSSKLVKKAQRRPKADSAALWRVDKLIESEASNKCPACGCKGAKAGPVRSMTLQDMLFGRFSLKRRVVRYECQPYWCKKCQRRFGIGEQFPQRGRPFRYGRSLLAYLFYQIIDLRIPMGKVIPALGRLFGLYLNPGSVASFKETLARYYSQTYEQILQRIASGNLVHVDETHVTFKRRRAYVWVFANMREVAYRYSETREGDLLHTTLGQFKGVLVSDFYTIYDSLDCPQQRCLIHLLRDLNEELLRSPYDEEFKLMVKDFGVLLQTIIKDVDRYGLKRHFLNKHRVSVDRFFKKAIDADYQSPAALACRERFQKNRDKLFTFLEYDGVPWNNNNAEHAIKAFAKLREFIESGATEKGIREYLVLLSICETCRYSGVDFLDFLRSGEKDIHAFAESRRGRKSRSPRSEPQTSPLDKPTEK